MARGPARPSPAPSAAGWRAPRRPGRRPPVRQPGPPRTPGPGGEGGAGLCPAPPGADPAYWPAPPAAGAASPGMDRQEPLAALTPAPAGAPAPRRPARPPPPHDTGPPGSRCRRCPALHTDPAGPPTPAPEADTTRPAPAPAGARGGCTAPGAALEGRRRAAGAGPSAHSRVPCHPRATDPRAPTAGPHGDGGRRAALDARRQAKHLYSTPRSGPKVWAGRWRPRP